MTRIALFLFCRRSQIRQILSAVLLLALACFFGVIAGCGGNSSSTTPPPQGIPPANLVYPQTTITVTVGNAIVTDTPTVTGTVSSFAVSPALPAGLGLSASTGAISGTPTAVAAQASYIITATNSAGSTTATVQIAVNLAPPTNLVYPQTAITAIVGQAIATDTPTVNGTVTTYTVSPALPAGLGLSASTGAISGTPTAVTAQASYIITATNSAGSTTATVQIAVNLAPPTNLVYPQTAITAIVGQAIATDTPTVNGTVITYTVSPALPAGLGLSASTGAISGTPTAVTPQATYTITATNSAGSTTATVQITVTLAPPTNLVYPQTTIAAIVGSAIATDTPTVTGTVATYTVSPALPAGLGLSASTGAISGTPTAATPQTTYTIAATNSAGSTTATVQITVTFATPPTNLDYPQATITSKVGQAIATDTPTVNGTVTTYTVSPALPAGLSLSASTGAISGTPTAATPQATYTITATNSAGSTTATVTITVASFTVFSLLDLGQTGSIVVMRLQPTRLFTQDGNGHWVLWDYTTTTELASGDGAGTPLYPSDMAGSVLAIGIANAVEVRSNVDGSLIATLTSPSLDPVPTVPPSAWWKLSTDGTYIASGYASGLSVWSTSNGHLLFSRHGDYSIANAFAASGQLQIALGPAGANVIETDSVPSGTSSVGPAFTANFNTWFTDGSHFLTNTPNLSPPANSPVYDVYTYSAATVQQGMLSLSDPGGLNGYANWFWTYTFNNILSLYPIGATTPTTTYTLDTDTVVIPSGSTLGVLPYGTPAASTIDLSGTTPTLSSSTALPVAYEHAFAALSPSQWAVGNVHGVVLDGPSATTTPRFFGYGTAYDIAAAPGHVVISTAIGKILEFETSSPAIVGSINFPAGKIVLSSDGSVLAAAASFADSQYEPDRTLNIYSLPAGTVTYSFPYQLTTPHQTTPFLSDFSLSGSGTALGQYLGTPNGSNTVYTRQVTPLSGSPIIWSDNPPSDLDSGNSAIFLSPDGTLVAVSTGAESSTSTTSIYKNGTLAATVNGYVVGWIDNNRVLVNTFGTDIRPETLPPYTGTVIYDATGAQLTTLNALPQLAPGMEGAGGFLTVDSNSIYSNYSIYSLTTGAVTWTEPLSLGGVKIQPQVGPSALSGNYLVFVYGARILVDLP
ncbi:putative Ig domain-containing protein [Tunturiibacter empetritectus]|uniref:Uncharacterized protein n=1 Tax=Tunturiibacter lichenicola TaxID=2051959 RepID=A0A852VL89_9BACT|nr:putative Ig domain-containing protein [Edaphobacter lichenicola]NYF92049.1 hypothetical protein [Edaphobacter lichenicola]